MVLVSNHYLWLLTEYFLPESTAGLIAFNALRPQQKLIIIIIGVVMMCVCAVVNLDGGACGKR